MRPLLFTLAAGVLLAFSLPPHDVEWLGWIALAPLFVAARGRRPLEAFGLGMLAGLTCGFVPIGWAPNAAGLQFAYLPFLWLAMLLGIVTAGATEARRRGSGARWALFVACLGVGTEWMTTFSPLPLNLALCQSRSLPVIQIAALTGIWGVSFLVWWTNAALADALLVNWKNKTCFSPLLALALTVGYGYRTLSGSREASEVRLRVAAIQDHPEGETALLVPAAAGEAAEADRDELTRLAVAGGARLVVWSENCLGATFAPATPADPTADLARELGVHLVVGYSEAARPLSFNCAAIVAPNGSVRGVHRKLYPFMGERQGVQPGRVATAFDTALGRIGIEICFDSCYSEVTRRIARSGARLIAMPNYDPPTRHGILHRLHAAVLPFRAVENHIPFVRADPHGLSQIVDATGRIVGQSPLYVPDMLLGDVVLGNGRGTPFTWWGDWLAYLCLIGVIVSAATSTRANRDSKSTLSD